jgi:glycosyltransferase involved in cell wall biosynthesis
LRQRGGVTDDSPPANSAQSLRVSVVIPNYNYADFVAQAIESALAIDWPAVEVIVVDDGSTDASREVIARYADRVTIVHQANAGQTAACNAGFARARGDLVVFLDSDDWLEPSLMREVARVWRPGISKVQFQMRIVDADGRPSGAVLPQFRLIPSAEEVRRWARTAASYPTPPGSGNVYARTYLEKIFPLVGDDRAADSYCLAVAPYLGDVVTIAKPLVAYRVHGRNDGAMATLDKRRFAVELARAASRLRYARAHAHGAGVPEPEVALARSLNLLPYRLASLKLAHATHPVVDDNSLRVLFDLAGACFVPQGVTRAQRAVLVAWSLSLAVAPPKLAEKLALWRFSSASRPRSVARMLRALKILSAPAARA